MSGLRWWNPARRRWQNRPATPAEWAASTGPWATEPPPDPYAQRRARRRAALARVGRTVADAAAEAARWCVRFLADTILDGGGVWALFWLMHLAWQTPVPGFSLAVVVGWVVRCATTRQPCSPFWRTPRDRW